jgi:hypothetical protein
MVILGYWRLNNFLEMIDYLEAAKKRAFAWMEERDHQRSKHDNMHQVLHSLHKGR